MKPSQKTTKLVYLYVDLTTPTNSVIIPNFEISNHHESSKHLILFYIIFLQYSIFMFIDVFVNGYKVSFTFTSTFFQDYVFGFIRVQGQFVFHRIASL